MDSHFFSRRSRVLRELKPTKMDFSMALDTPGLLLGAEYEFYASQLRDKTQSLFPQSFESDFSLEELTEQIYENSDRQRIYLFFCNNDHDKLWSVTEGEIIKISGTSWYQIYIVPDPNRRRVSSLRAVFSELAQTGSDKVQELIQKLGGVPALMAEIKAANPDGIDPHAFRLPMDLEIAFLEDYVACFMSIRYRETICGFTVDDEGRAMIARSHSRQYREDLTELFDEVMESSEWEDVLDSIGVTPGSREEYDESQWGETMSDVLERELISNLPDSSSWVIKTDQSLRTNSAGLELVSPPLPPDEFFQSMESVFSFIKENGFTDHTCGFHIGVSFPGIEDINLLKLLCLMEDSAFLKDFPERVNSRWAQSARKILRQVIDSFLEKRPEDPRVFLRDPLRREELEQWCRKILIDRGAFNPKSLGMNVTKLRSSSAPYIEFRYLGGFSYEKKLAQIRRAVVYYVTTLLACRPGSRQGEKEYLRSLSKFLLGQVPEVPDPLSIPLGDRSISRKSPE